MEYRGGPLLREANASITELESTLRRHQKTMFLVWSRLVDARKSRDRQPQWWKELADKSANELSAAIAEAERLLGEGE